MLKKLGTLAKNLEAEREGMKGMLSKVDGMEGRMKGLQHLSELISVRYNPFLQDTEGALTDGRRAKDFLPSDTHIENAIPHSPLAEIVPLMAGGLPPQPAPEPDVPQVVEPPVASHVPQHVDAPAPAPAVAKSAPHPPPAPAHRPASHQLAQDLAKYQETRPIAQAARMPSIGVEPASHHAFPPNVQNPREAYIVLEWFEYLLKRIPAREIPKLIDYYHGIGWIDQSLHGWFLTMAEGIAGPRTPAGDAAFQKEGPRRLVKVHKATLRFLDLLHEPTLAHGASQSLERRTRAAFRDR